MYFFENLIVPYAKEFLELRSQLRHFVESLFLQTPPLAPFSTSAAVPA